MLKVCLTLLSLFVLETGSLYAATWSTNYDDPLTSVPFNDASEVFLAPPMVTLTRGTSETVWISDIEEIAFVDENKNEQLLIANSPHKLLMGSGVIRAGNRFELFPYHYVEKDYVKKTKEMLNYHLIVRNEGDSTATLCLSGIGTVTGWAHWRPWDGALSGAKAAIVTLSPKQQYTVWSQKGLQDGLPYSGVMLGTVKGGDLHVYDYCYTGDDPGIDGCQPVSDLTWAPKYDPAFIRGTAPWFTGMIKLFPQNRTQTGDIPVSAFGDKVNSVAFGYSPGGPITNLCLYNAVAPSFADDICMVLDPVSKKKHVFFGGNYPIVYSFDLPLFNDLDCPVEIEFLLSSNDVFGVNTYVGVWMNEKVVERDAPAIVKNNRLHVWKLKLAPNERYLANMRVVPLGSKWGGLVGSFRVNH